MIILKALSLRLIFILIVNYINQTFDQQFGRLIVYSMLSKQ